ncbi:MULTISPECIES: hypothetical protein [Bacillales]|jgi:hypothetical protein|uniref:Uncharacterized protein n=1 Tax=Brevibacillus aydinogluensis TaxID=927786 RepID=A0AA48RI52_9BACL|nr:MULTISPECIES: hypothetical protein [Bacillales]MBR8659119.1 hypothetical protein [Brevibacillus sp. NL20B1]MDT3418020.1 hypothetical protein [Brevibacillus aydinogluensis]NNV02838.1 hypothetical protein [Brevibacillus sp. MCWH]UFJ60259.1 hypothetical protein IRT44_13285 [Anoxybacillus sediminis]CAJ1003080.1 hypothetical protein BSPP4475_12190 [Brevibacillus aydinogluensis]
MLNNNPRKFTKIGRKVRAFVVHSPSDFAITLKRKAAVQAAMEARKKYAKPDEKLFQEIYADGPSVTKNDDHVRIVATRNVHFDEPMFG